MTVTPRKWFSSPVVTAERDEPRYERCLNLGCGRRFHHSFTNLDYFPAAEGIIAHNLTKGVPFPDGAFDLIYHSHVLEHLSRDEGAMLIRECCRVLRPGGVLRVVIPDLEQLARLYLQALEHVDRGSEEWRGNYEWLMLELLDQTARTEPGGLMPRFFDNPDVPNEDFVVQRWGHVARDYFAEAKKRRRSPEPPRSEGRASMAERVVELVPQGFKRRILNSKFGDLYKALKIGRYRLSGEVHQWMYDRYSIVRLLEENGFHPVAIRTATESYVPNWTRYNLDTDPDGTVAKPDSLFVEGVRARFGS